MSDNFEDVLSKIEELKVILESYEKAVPESEEEQQ